MAKVKTWSKPTKRLIGISCACLAMLTMIPSTAVAAKAADVQEKWIGTEEVSMEEAEKKLSDTPDEQYAYADGTVTEIYVGSDIMPYTTLVDMSGTVEVGTRYTYRFRSMEAGESISISMKCSNSEATYHIGIKNQTSGELRYVSGTGKLIHDFEIKEDGKYAAFVENCSDVTITVTGSATYFD